MGAAGQAAAPLAPAAWLRWGDPAAVGSVTQLSPPSTTPGLYEEKTFDQILPAPARAVLPLGAAAAGQGPAPEALYAQRSAAGLWVCSCMQINPQQ